MSRPQPVSGLAGAPSDTTLRISLLGPMLLTRGDSVIDLSGPKRRALVTLLAMNVGEMVSTEQIIEALWPANPTGREQSTLQVHVSHVRDRIEATRDAPPTALVTHALGYMLSGDTVEVDVAGFDQLVAEVRRLVAVDPVAALQACDEALGLWRGRALQDVEYEEFAQDEVRRLELARTETVTNRAEALVATGRDGEAVEVLEGLVRAEPSSERPVRLLMTALYRTGRQADALRVFRRHSRRLVEQGLVPSSTISDLETRILQHDPDLLPVDTVEPRDLGPGRSVRGYELREEVGSGTTGTVFRAFQAAVGRDVAIKVVDPDLAQSPEFVRRFAEEAQLIAGLEHPSIVPLYDFWREPIGAYLVMRWMDGGNLLDRMTQPFEVDVLGRAFGQLADALEYAHSAGVVHRGLKPANVLFDRQGNAYLGDFRLAAVTASDRGRHPPIGIVEGGYASPEQVRGEGSTVASDIFGLGTLLAQSATGGRFRGVEPPVPGPLREVVQVATAPAPADRYPDIAAFRAALGDAIGRTHVRTPRRVRRNPYKGLEPFEEADRADFYGRDDVVETLVGMLDSRNLVALIGASGSGKSSVVKAGVVTQIRDGALPGSEEWYVVIMVPGTDPFDEFHLGLRSAGVGHARASSGNRELRDSFVDALDTPNGRALLVVDQFEELFSSAVDEHTRERFLDNLVDLTDDPGGRFRVLLTLRADFSDRPLSHGRFGGLLANGSCLLGPIDVEQIEDVIRRPAARVGVQLEPGLVAEMVRDVVTAPAFLPLLQYALSEMFERRREDRLTVSAYRSLGGIDGVLERQAEATYAELDTGARNAARQLFLRMVYLGDHGEETRRRVPLTELRGLGEPAHIDEALAAFTAARLVAYDRDPVTRTPTIEVAHETVIGRWTRFRDWIGENRSTLGAHRRLATAVHNWAESGEHHSYLLSGAQLASAVDLAGGHELQMNELEQRFVCESQAVEQEANRHEARRRQEEAELRLRARRRLTLGLAASSVAVVVALLAVVAWGQWRSANDLADAQERQSMARRLASASLTQLDADPEVSMLLAVEAADLSIDAGDPVLPEVVEALHRSVIAPKPQLVFERGATGPVAAPNLIAWARDGSVLAVIDDRGGVTLVSPTSGAEQRRLATSPAPATGVAIHPMADRVLTVHGDGVREWDTGSLATVRDLPSPGGAATAAYSPTGDLLAFGTASGEIHVWSSSEEVVRLTGLDEPVAALSFAPDGERLVSAAGTSVVVWELASGERISEGPGQIVLPVVDVEWTPTGDTIAIALAQGEMYVFDAVSGERGVSFSSGATFHNAVTFDGSGALVVAAGADGLARAYSTGTGGAPIAELPHDGAAVQGVAADPSAVLSTTVATLDADGRVRIWRDIFDRSELAARPTGLLYPQMSQADERYVVAGYGYIFGLATDAPPVAEVVDGSTANVVVRVPTNQNYALLWRQPAITRRGDLVAIAGESGDIEVVPVDGGESVILPESANWTNALTFDDDGRRLVGAGFDGSLAIWDAATGELLDVVTPGGGDPGVPARPVIDVEFRPGTLEVGWARRDGLVGAWDVASGQGRILHELDRPTASIAFAPDGAALAVANTFGAIVVLDADSGTITLTPDPVPGDTQLAFSPDGRHLAGAGPGPYAHLWDAESGSLVRRFHGSIGPPRGVAFVDGGAAVRVAGSAGFDRGYVIDPVELTDLAKGRRTRELTDAECQRFLGARCSD